MKGVTQDVISEVRARASLHEVIGEHLTLKKAGKEYSTLCPFHKEKSASFFVNPDKGIYKCFSCGEGGDVFSFIMKYKGLNFPDAVRELAQRYGVPLVETEEERLQFDKRTACLMLNQQAAEYFSHLLADPTEGQTARDYLYKRGITDDIITRFKLGYAPASWDALSSYLITNTKVTPQTLDDAGLAKLRPESNGCYDFFRHRLMIPIFDDQGRVIAFGGRTLGDDPIKYLNSPATPTYTKGYHLFALHLAKDAIKKKDAVLVVEGYFDAITSHLYGFDNTVAVCGTALTEQQSRALIKYTESKRVYLAFDADAAGVRAIDSGAVTLNQIAQGIGLDLKVIRIPGGKDPDECLRTMDQDEHVGPGLYEKAVAEAPALIEYQLDKAVEGVDVSSHLGKIDAAKKVIPVLAQIRSTVAMNEYVRQWALKLGISEQALLSDLRQYQNNHRPMAQSANHRSGSQGSGDPNKARGSGTGSTSVSPSRHLISSRGALMSGHVNSEQQLLALYLTSRDDYDRVYRHMQDELFISAPHQRIKDAIEGVGSNFETMEDLRSQLLDRLSPDGEALAAFVEVVLKVDVLRKQNLPVEKIILEFRVVILKERITRMIGLMQSSLGTAETDADLGAAQSKIIQFNNLKRELTNPELSLDEIAILKHKIDGIISDSDSASAEGANPTV